MILADVTFPVAPLWSTWLILAVAGALVLTLAWSTVLLLRKGIGPRWVAVLTALRVGILALFVLILLQPIVVYTGLVEQRPELLVLVDTSRSMAVPSGTGSRLQEVLDAVRQGELAEALRANFRLSWYVFDTTARPLDEQKLTRLLAEGPTINLAESLAAAGMHVQALGRKPGRVLLLSDGNDQGTADPVEVARRFGMTVDVLAPTPSDVPEAAAVEIAEVQAARRVLLGSETHFRLTMTRRPAADQELHALVRLSEDGKPLWERPVVMKAGQSEETLLLMHRPETAGLRQYEFRLLTGPREAPQPVGKKFSLQVQVLDSKYEVLILEDTWRWEYKYLHRLFEEDPSFRFTALLSRGSKAYAQFGSPDRRVNLVGFPQGRGELEGFDAFFLGDVVPSRWPRGLAPALAQLVTEEGRSLVVIAGPGLANLLEFPELHALLPVELTPDSGKPAEGPIDVRLRPDSTSSPLFFQLRGEPDALPPVDRVYPALRKRPGATVLLEAAKQRNPYGNLIVLAEHTVGRGRVVFVGTDTLWKWHTLAPGEGPSPYSIFWQQAFRALTPNRSSAAPVNLWLTPGRSRGEVGRPLTIHAEVQSDRPLPGAQLQATVALPDERRLPLVFAAAAASPLRFQAEFVPPKPGLHRITASVLSEGKTVAEATAALPIDEAQAEQSDRGIDHVGLARLAQSTHGKLVDPRRSDTWPQPEPPTPPRIEQRQTLDLWNNFTLLLALCVLLGADWFVRLFKGFV